MKFENVKTEEQYIDWVKQWKITHVKLVEIQKVNRMAKKTKYHNDVWYTDEQKAEILKWYTSIYYRDTATRVLAEKEYGHWCIPHIKVRGKLRDMYEQRKIGKEFYHEELSLITV